MAGFFDKGGTGSNMLSNIPLISTGVGLISSLFGDSEADIRKRRQDELIKQNEMYRQRAIARANLLKQQGIKDISKETSTQLNRAQSDVARRAAASGRTSDTEAMLLPVASNISEAGGKNLETAIQGYDAGISNLNTQYDQNALGIQSDIAAAPIEPSVSDELLSAGGSAVNYLNQDRYLKAMEQINSPNTGSVPFNPNNIIIPKKQNYSDLTTLRLRGGY